MQESAEEKLRRSRDYYLKLFDEFPNPIWRSNTSGDCDYFNKEWLAFTGRTTEQELGDGWTKGVHPDDFDRCLAIYTTAFKAHESFEMEYRLRYNDGTYHWLLDCGKPFYDLDGHFAGYIGSCYDINERKLAEKALKENENRYRTLFEESPISLWEEDFSNLRLWIDKKEKEGVTDIFTYFKDHPEKLSKCADMGRVISANRATTFLFKASSSMEFCKNASQIFSTESQNEFLKEIIALSKGEIEYEGEIVLKTFNGEPKTVIMRLTAVPGHEETLSRIFVSVTDITRRKAMEKALVQTNKKMNMLSSITRHDILNLIMVVRGYLELSVELVDSPKLKEYIQKEIDAVDAIQKQIEFTRYYQNIGVEEPDWKNVEEIIDNTSQQLSPEGIKIENSISCLEVFADPLIEKVFYNLIENSLRHGKHLTTIRFSDFKTENGHIISYQDDGYGISNEDKKKLFQKGFGKHTGLGLFLSREILSITGITILEKGEYGKGVNFEILLPEGTFRCAQEKYD